MTKKVSTAHAKAKLSEIVSQVAETGERYVVARRGKPLAGVVSMEDLARLEAESPPAGTPAGALALVGIWPDIDDDEWDAIIRDIYRARSKDRGRRVNLQP
jgi:prevent-host-death family protein